MNKLMVGTVLTFSIVTAAFVVGGCQSKPEETAADASSSAEQSAPQSNPNAAPRMSPEAAKAAEDAMRRDKRGY